MKQKTPFFIRRRKHWAKQLFLSTALMLTGVSFMNTTPLQKQTVGQQRYLSSSFGSVSPVDFSHKKLTNELSVDLVQFRSLNQNFGSTQLQNSTEAHTNLAVNYKVKHKLFITSDVGFSYSKQSIRTRTAVAEVDRRTEKMFYGSLGMQKYFLRNMLLQGNAGLIHSKKHNSGESEILPTGSLQLSHKVKKTTFSLALASQALGGGSFTGIYGNQILNHGKVGLAFAVTERFGVESSLAYGQTRNVFEGSVKANVLASSLKANYQLDERFTASIGYFHRKLTNENKFDTPTSEGSMFSASVKFTY